MTGRWVSVLVLGAATSLVAAAACSANSAEDEGESGGAGGAAATGGLGGSGGSVTLDGSAGGEGGVIPDPESCEEAEAGGTYVGCEFWPTVTDNIVVPSFDFAAVVANTGSSAAELVVERNGAEVKRATVPANGVVKLYLPWVPELKSLSSLPGQADSNCPTWVKTSTVRAAGGAYRLSSSRPVAVWQFNALEYGPQGGEPGKDWSFCQRRKCLPTSQCFSYTNDASLLLPTTALTGTYRITGSSPWTDTSSQNPDDPNPSSFTFPSYFAITGTADGTNVTVQLSQTGAIAAGGGVPATPKGGTARFQIGRGDVVMVVGTKESDFSGSLVRASAPVQIVSGIACTNYPSAQVACDHLEESVLPAETLGRRYFVTRPTGFDGQPRRHGVRIYGNVDGTTLSYPSGDPGGPTTIGAGEMVELETVEQDFEIVGDHEFAVASFQHGAGPQSGERQGDPSQSAMTTVEQYRRKYVFLAPDDYDQSFADLVIPDGTTVRLDGAPISATITPLGSGYGVARVRLANNGGSHRLEADRPVGVQVVGYGAYTSYQYPGGLNLGRIAPVPPR
jgi:hypothetical protein